MFVHFLTLYMKGLNLRGHSFSTFVKLFGKLKFLTL